MIADIFFIREYFFRTRYSTLQTSMLIGLTVSFIIATISEVSIKEPKHFFRNIYKLPIAIPLVIVMILLTLSSMNQ